MPRSVLITGAMGRIGSVLTAYLDAVDADAYALRLGDIRDIRDSQARGVSLDVTDLAACRAACVGIDTVVHLAGIPDPDTPFELLLPNNIVGTYHLFRAAADAKVRRVVFASSAQVTEGYPLDVQIRSDMPVRPKNLYGVSKAFGEAAGAYFAYQEGLEVIAVRIGAFQYARDWTWLSARDLSAWVEPNDLCQLLQHCIEADLGEEPFAIAHGISDNRFKRLDLSETRLRFGYAPTADAFSTWNLGLKAQSKSST